MSRSFKTGGRIQGAGGDVDEIIAPRIPKKAGAAYLTKAAVNPRRFISDGTKPFEGLILLEDQVLPAPIITTCALSFMNFLPINGQTILLKAGLTLY